MASSGDGGGKLSAVDAILAEAADMIALEQIAKLNTAHLVDDSSALPSSLESRFRKLKSLPAAPAPARAAAAPVKTLGRSVTAPHATLLDPPRPNPAPEQPPAPTVQEEQQPGDVPQQVRRPATVPAVHDDDEDLERLFGSGGRGRPTLRERNGGRDDDDDGRSPSPPPRTTCCFGFSPKKTLQRTQRTPTKGKKIHGAGDSDVLGIDAGEWGDENKRMVTELKEQQRKLKKALEDQVKVSRETAKMARWVKQASARMTHTTAIDDLLSDCEDDEELK